MPYGIIKSPAACPISKPWGVVKTGTASVVPGGCHVTKQDAQEHLAALMTADSKTVKAANGEVVSIPVTQFVTIADVDIATVGDWNTIRGNGTFTPEDLAACVAADDDPGFSSARIKLGHTDPRFDGEPVFGTVKNLRLSPDQQTLVGDIEGIPSWLADILPTAYPQRSIEASRNTKSFTTGREYSMVLTGLALLGAFDPAVSTLDDLQAMFSPEGPAGVNEAIMAGSTNFGENTSKGDGMSVHASVNIEDVRRSFYDAYASTNPFWWVRSMMLDPDELIVDDDQGCLYRVPFTVNADGTVTFDPPAKVQIQYVDVPGQSPTPPAAPPAAPMPAPSYARAPAATWASRAESVVHAGAVAFGDLPLGDRNAKWDAAAADTRVREFTKSQDAPSATYRKAFFWFDAANTDQFTAYKLPFADVVNGTLIAMPKGIFAGAARISSADLGGDESAVQGVMEKYYAKMAKAFNDDTITAPWTTSAASKDGTAHGRPVHNQQEGTEMDTTAIITRLGLAENATEDDVLAAIDAITTPGDPVDTGDAGGDDASNVTPPEGTVLIDETQLAELRSQAEMGVAARQQQMGEDRDRIVADAVQAGKVPPARREYWREYLDRDPDGGREILATMKPGLPVGAPVGTPDVAAAEGGDDSYPAHWFGGRYNNRQGQEG